MDETLKIYNFDMEWYGAITILAFSREEAIDILRVKIDEAQQKIKNNESSNKDKYDSLNSSEIWLVHNGAFLLRCIETQEIHYTEVMETVCSGVVIVNKGDS